MVSAAALRLLLLAAPAAALIVSPALRSPISVAPARCPSHCMAASGSLNEEGLLQDPTAVDVQPPGRRRRVVRFARGVASRLNAFRARCDEEVRRIPRPAALPSPTDPFPPSQFCSITGVQFAPRQWLRNLVPRKRPLKQLQFCEAGTVKVARVDGQRRMFYQVNAESCELNMDAMDMF